MTVARTCRHCETGQAMERFEFEFDADSARLYAAAGDALAQQNRERSAREIRRIRRWVAGSLLRLHRNSPILEP
jgi:hypothetical protein